MRPLLVLVLATGVSSPVLPAEPVPAHPPAAERQVASAGTVESVSGRAMKATRDGWAPLRAGDALADGTSIQLMRGAALSVRYESGEVVRYAPAPSAQSLEIVVRRRP